MTDNPTETSLANIPELPDFNKLQNTVRFINAQGQEVEMQDANLLDFTPSRGDNLLPIVKAGQAEETRGSEVVTEGKKKTTVYPLEKSLFLEIPQYGESEETDKPTLHTTYQKLPDNKMFFIPVGFDQQRRYWQGQYDPENAVEPDCQSNRYLVYPAPDEKFLQRDENGKLVSGKYSHTCMALGPNGVKPFCPLAQWTDGNRPPCVHYATIYGLLYLPGEFEPTLVVTQYKRGSIESGLTIQQHLNKLTRQSLPVYSNPMQLSHAKPNDQKAGYTYFILHAKQEGKIVSTSQMFPDFAEQYGNLIAESVEKVNGIIQASRDYGAMKPVVSLVNAEVNTVDTPF